VAAFFRELAPTRAERLVAPNLLAYNFMLYDALAGGASRSLRIDTQGKALGQAILRMSLPRPANLDAMRRTVRRVTG
jgi:hypothetical protein